MHLPEVNVAMCCMHGLIFFSFRKLQSFLETHANGSGFDVDSAFLVVLTWPIVFTESKESIF